jgi:hypothetical protein
MEHRDELRKMQEWLDINNRDYHDGRKSRQEWTAENKRLVALCAEKNLGVTLPSFAITDR